jgi:hypothetical protein
LTRIGGSGAVLGCQCETHSEIIDGGFSHADCVPKIPAKVLVSRTSLQVSKGLGE